ncbi:MAG TPA: TonB-dependent receptor [Steroidobacteraceae bacterium]|jgi:iron complex outermembrane receptor protein|nr:TonB-dependent receptor [Steroidobacteraceae bacterium]
MQNDATKNALAGASSLLALAVTVPATAQSTGDDSDGSELKEVIVTGIRGSLQRNLDMKRDAVGVVDVISSEDIGKFPDSNVAASLQRVPGVSIQRNGQRGEPTGITVRGFGGDFNETLYDGRRISTAAGGRSVDFSTVGADFVGALHVMKTPDITLSSSSIGATINVEYPKPMDHLGLRMVASAAGTRQDESGDTKPTVGMLLSDTFADDTLGILIDGIYTDHTTTANRVFVSGWEGGRFAPCQLTPTCTPAELAPSANKPLVGWWQQQYGAEQSTVADKRIDGRIAFQWRPSDQLLLTVDDNYSRQTLQTDTYGFALWFGINDLRSVSLDDNGTVVDFRQAATPMDLNATVAQQVRKTNQTGVNLKYDLSDHLSFDVDASYAKSWQNPNGEQTDNGDIGYGGALGCNLGVRVTGDSSSHFPELTDFGPGCDESRVFDQSVIGSHVLVRQRQENTDTLKQGRFSVRWAQDDVTLDLGTSYVEDNFTLQQSNTFANNFWQAFAGYGAPSGRSAGLVVPANVYGGTIGTSGFIPGFSGGGSIPGSLQKYDPRALYAFLQGLGDPWAQQLNGFNYPGPNPNPTNEIPTLANSLSRCAPGGDHPALCDYHGSLDLALDPGSVQDITEKTWSVFVRAGFQTKINDMPFHLSAGIRDERTNVSSSGIGRLPVLLTVNPSDPTLLTTAFSDSQPITTKSSYNFLLPSLDMKLELTDKVHLRFDASRTLTRPAINFLTPVLNVGSLPRIGALTANGGNPRLKPYLSDNFDFAVEWYYQPNSYAAIDAFTKDVTNFIVQGTQRQTINNVIDPSTGQPAIYTVSQRVNGPDARIHGFELAWQHVFGDTGFGFNANATIVDTNKPYDRQDISQSGFAVTGLADSANFIGFYDKNGFEVRVAANWRDEYLLQFGQNQNNSAFGAEPTYVNSSLQVDFSTSYQFTRGLNVFFEVLNVTNDTMSTHGRFDNQMLDVFSYGRRYALGARYKL